MAEHKSLKDRCPGLGGALAVCEKGHRAMIRNGDFPYVGHCSTCSRQRMWYKIEP